MAIVLIVGGWGRFARLDLLEFKSDEAVAANLALEFVESGKLPTAGLMSSVGVKNPPLFIYALIPMFVVSRDPAVVSGLIACLGLGAVVATWWFVRKYHGPVAGLVAAALFAVSPWAVIYSRKIWAQDLVPVCTTGLLWALHALVLGRKPKAVFWVVLLPLCVIQIHYSGLALTAAVLVILCVLRPRLDWRWAGAGAVVAAALLVPYLQFQAASGWQDFKQAAALMGGQKLNIPKGITIHPDSGYALPRRPSEAWIHALAIQNAGEIEDVLGLSAAARFDTYRIWQGKGRVYFESRRTPGGWLLTVQRAWFVIALVWLGWRAVRQVKILGRWPFFVVNADESSWLLLLWCVVPLAVFMAAGLWTYLSYYAILLPAHFVVVALVVEESRRLAPAARRLSIAAVGLAVALGVANSVVLKDCYTFLDDHGGAQGTYGTGLGYKQAAARYLAERTDPLALFEDQRFLQLDVFDPEGRPQWARAQWDLPWLAAQARGRLAATASLPTNTVVLVVDENRSNYDPRQVPQLTSATQTNFGPMRLYFIERP